MTIELLHKISLHMKLARVKGILPWLLPDNKTQVTIQYMESKGRMIPLRVHTIVVTAQHTPDITVKELREAILNQIIRKAVPPKYLDCQTIYHVCNFPVFPSSLLISVQYRFSLPVTLG